MKQRILRYEKKNIMYVAFCKYKKKKKCFFIQIVVDILIEKHNRDEIYEADQKLQFSSKSAFNVIHITDIEYTNK